MKIPFAFLISLIFLVICAEANAHTLLARSGAQKVMLLELYSSESCSSCPPADRWISGLQDSKDLWKNFIPVVFHVDYWNYLGWKDGYSSDAMTKRQQEIVATWSSPTLYTPGIVLDGKEWRGWRTSPIPSRNETINLRMSLYQEGKNEFQVIASGLPIGSEYTIRLALLGMGLSTSVKSGENSGRVLEHNFIVLDWDSKPANHKNSSLRFHLDAKSKSAKKLAIVAWIEHQGSPIPLQATGSYLTE